MPSLPGGAEPLSIQGGGAAAKAKAKAKGKQKRGKGGNRDTEAATPPIKKRKGDDELLQLDLKRKRHTISSNAEAQPHN